MRISYKYFTAEIQPASAAGQNTGFRYVLSETVDGEDVIIYESHPFQLRHTCIAKADDHLDQLVAWRNFKAQLSSWESEPSLPRIGDSPVSRAA